MKNTLSSVAVGLGVFLASMPALFGDAHNFQATWIRPGGSTRVADFRIYVPPTVEVPRIKGVIFLYPGSGGDWRFRADDTVWQEGARSLGFALVGAGSNAGYTSISAAEAQTSLTAILAAAATATGRREIVNAPTVFTGYSLGGFVSTEMVNYVPDQVIAAIGQRGSSVFNAPNPTKSRNVPLLFIPGSLDINLATSPNETASNFTGWRAGVGLSGYAVDWLTPHDTFANQGWSMAWTWIAESIALRYPAGVLPGLNPGESVALQTIPLTSGWLGDRPYATSATGADRSTYEPIAPYAEYPGDLSKASWLPNETVARTYRAFTSYDGATGRAIPLQGPLAIVGAAAPGTVIQAGQVNPPQMAVLPVGSTIDIACDPRGFGQETVVLAPQNLIANGDFSLWTSGKPDSWTGGPAGLSQGPDLLSATGKSAVLRDNASLLQTFVPLASDFQLRFTFTINLTPGNTAWNQPLVFNVYQANQTVNPTKPWMTFQFAAQNVSTGPFTIAAFTSDTGSSVVLPGSTITGSTYDFTVGAFTGGPVKYDFVLNYFAASNSYSVCYGPAGGPLVSSGRVAYFRNPTNASFGGINQAFFYSYVNGLALDAVRLSTITSVTPQVQQMAFYDGATPLGTRTAPDSDGIWRLPTTLGTVGIHSLTVEATDSLGNKSSAFRTVVVPPLRDLSTSYWRFDSVNTTDHYDNLPLTEPSTVALRPTAVVRPATGAGSKFPDLEEVNDRALQMSAGTNKTYLSAVDNANLPSGAMPFTVEAFVNLASSSATRAIAAQGSGSTTNLGWQFVVTSETSGAGARNLIFQFTTDGTSPGTLDTIDSDLQLQMGVDYYVAIAFTPGDTSSNGARFYLKDLTNNGNLIEVKRTHTRTSVFDSTALFTLGAEWFTWDGLLDEVRLTKRACSSSELLVSSQSNFMIAADDSRISYSDYVRKTFVTSPMDANAKLARFDRILPMPGKGYEWDNPGTRIRFRTDAPSVQALLYYNDKHTSTSGRNSKGFYLVDGVSNPAWTFQTVATTTVRAPEQVTLTLPVPVGGGFHDYEIILPYADSVDFQGVNVLASAQFQPPSPRPAFRYLTYGDSVTQGFTASEVGKTYAYLVAQKKHWQLLNMGVGGRAVAAADGTTMGQQNADAVSVLIGVNDWQGGTPLETFRTRMSDFLTNLRTQQPTVPIYLITPLWVGASWNPPSDITDLENYRQIIREVHAAKNDPKIILIEGMDLIDHNTDYFDPVLVHPNDAGFAMMADRLSAKMFADISGWRFTYFGTESNDGNAADLSDPDGDGTVNLLEYALGLSPLLPSAAGLPTTQVQQVGGVDYLTLTFTRRVSATDVTFAAEATSDLASPWTSFDPLLPANQISVLQNTPEIGLQTVTIKDIQPLSASAKRFLRIRVNKS